MNSYCALSARHIVTWHSKQWRGLRGLAIASIAACAVSVSGGCKSHSSDDKEEASDASISQGGNNQNSSCAGESTSPYEGPSLVLSDRELQAAIEALFPFPVPADAALARMRLTHAFSSNPVGNAFTFNHVEHMADVAEEIAAVAHDRIDELAPCPVSTGAAGCADKFIDDFAARAFRRPLESDERDTLVQLYQAGTADGLTPAIAASTVIAAVLQSPQFLYQLDLGVAGDTADTYRLTSHEVASHLAFLFTGAPPDAELQSLADSDGLTTPQVVREQAMRLLETPAGQETAKRFIREWFDVEGIDYSTRLDPALADALSQEVERDLSSWLGKGAKFPVTKLLTSDTTFVNPLLAQHYGLRAPSGSDYEKVDLPDHYQAGLLSKGLIAARFSNLDEPSVIRRGVFVLTELLCTNLGTPPNDAVDRNPQLPPGSLPREKVDARGKLNPCGSCHGIIDPVGLGMEEIDQLGRFRSKYAGGEPVDNVGFLNYIDPSDFTGTAALAKGLAGSDMYLACAVSQWAEFALGARPDSATCNKDVLTDTLRQDGGSVRELMLGLVTSEAFLSRRRSGQESP